MSGIMLCDDILEMIGEHHLLIITHKQKMSSVIDDIESGGESMFYHNPRGPTVWAFYQNPHDLKNLRVSGDAEEASSMVNLIVGGWISDDLRMHDEFNWTTDFDQLKLLRQIPPHQIECATYYQHSVYKHSHGGDFIGSVLELMRPPLDLVLSQGTHVRAVDGVAVTADVESKCTFEARRRHDKGVAGDLQD
jgi:hypothetical protein